MSVYIYILLHPITNEIKYVGKTVNPKRRLYHHIEESRRNQGRKSRRVLNWINSLIKQELKPIMQIVEVCDENNWEEREIYWIQYYKNIGKDLCNIEIGGKHSSKAVSEETRKIHSDNLRKLRSKFSEEEKVGIWKLIQEGYNNDYIQEFFPTLTQSSLYQIRYGYKWQHITGLLKIKRTRTDFNTHKSMKNRGKGYFYNKFCKKWIVVITINKKKNVLGRFDTEREAISFVEEYRKTHSA